MSIFGLGKARKKTSISAESPDRLYLRGEHVQARIVMGDITGSVRLPPGVDLREWLASNTLAFFNHVNLYYGIVVELCTRETCPAMSAPGGLEYQWLGADKRKARSLPAPEYADYVMSEVQAATADEAVFPTKYGARRRRGGRGGGGGRR